MAGWTRVSCVRATPLHVLTRLFSSQIHQTIAGRIRFYKHVDIVQENNSWQITLDGRILKSPGRNPLLLPSKELAIAIAAEWDGQIDKKKGIQPSTMPLMILASTAIDQVKVDSTHTFNTCMSYLTTDTALFLTSNEDRILLKKQKQHFQPILRTMKRAYGLEFTAKQDIYGRIKHSDETTKKIEAMIKSLDHFSLTCLQSMTMECKSIILGLAYLGRYINLDEVRVASRLEEEFQVEIWGVVEGGHDMDRLNNQVSLSAAGLFMGLYLDNEQHKSQILDAWSK